ncbi:MAG: TIGR00730 family Rossman fold protein [Clostridia bacterium]|nr:TIGR00730 family Rossman fold protein [Clostridia bacterium]
MNICIYGSANDTIDKSFIAAGEKLGEEMAKCSHTLIFGGGACGMMGAVARGIKRNGGKIIGISPEFFNVDGILFEDCTEMIYTADMRSRKEKLEDMADAFIVTPGGIGTMDEFFETMSLKQLQIIKKPLIIFNVNGFYDNLVALLQNSAKLGFLGEDYQSLFFVSSDIKEIMDYLN